MTILHLVWLRPCDCLNLLRFLYLHTIHPTFPLQATGDRPWSHASREAGFALNETQLTFKIADPETVHPLPDDLPSWIRELVQHCTSYHPSLRYSCAQIQIHLDGVPAVTPAPSTASRPLSTQSTPSLTPQTTRFFDDFDDE